LKKYFVAIILLFQTLVFAQFSPGPLSKYHLELEGTSNCTKCHLLGKREISEGCLECHTILKARIDTNQGFHKDKVEDCGTCHSEHNGLDFEPIYWPEGMENFNHENLDFYLNERHALLPCEACHQEKYIVDPSIFLRPKTANSKSIPTFLGLSSACIVCHQNVHIKTMFNNCNECHDSQKWKNARLTYDHSGNQFPLIGAHLKASCEKCHPLIEMDNSKILQLTGIQHKDCSSCHLGVHRGEVSKNCESCHGVDNWTTSAKYFNHDSASFQLRGAHIKIACRKCHPMHQDWSPQVAQLTGLSFNACSSCHKDYHNGNYGLECSACHGTADWKNDLKPFGHSKTKYPLIGKHQKVACKNCHRQDLKGAMPKYSYCLDCHKDYHFNQFSDLSSSGDCGICHTVAGFYPTVFTLEMHQETRFPLRGAHITVPCNICHKIEELSEAVYANKFSWKTVACAVCHKNIHGNQFDDKYQNNCELCHNQKSFKVAEFDHAGTDFPITGKHLGLACNKCHFIITGSKIETVEYDGISHKCADCHTINEFEDPK